jgi:hypothetical protein
MVKEMDNVINEIKNKVNVKAGDNSIEAEGSSEAIQSTLQSWKFIIRKREVTILLREKGKLFSQLTGIKHEIECIDKALKEWNDENK